MTASAPTHAGRRQWLGLAVLALPTLLIATDMTVLHLAVPALSAALAPSSAQLLWIVDIYGFLIAGSLITMGTLGDRLGRRRLLLVGAAAFGGASVLAAFAPSAELLIAARALLGIAGATLMPSTLSLIRNLFLDAAQRRFAIAVWMTSFMAGTALGPLLGGFLLERFWWGSVFLINVPVMALLLALGPLLLPENRDPAAGRLDLLSAGQSLVAVLAVVYGVKLLAEGSMGWLAALSIAAGTAVGVVFLRRQRGLRDPFIDLRLFGVPAFSASLAAQTLAIFAMGGIQFFAAQYLQLVLGLQPFHAGLWSLPSTAAGMLGTLFVPLLVRWFRPALVIGVGLVLAAVGFGIIAQVDGRSLAALVAGLVVLSIGLAPAMTLTTDMIVGTAPPERAGAASAISETGAELGLALGIAILGSLGTAVYRGAIASAVPSGLSPEALEAARATLGGALAVAGGLPAPVGAALLAAARQAFVEGLQVTALVSAAVMVGTALLAVILLRPVPTDAERQRERQSEPASSPSEPPKVGTAA